MTKMHPAVVAKLAPRWDAQRQARNLQHIERHLARRPHASLSVAVLSGLAASVAAVCIFWLSPAHKPVSAVTAHTPVASASARAPVTETRFRDGSTATALTEGAVLELRTTSDSEMVVEAKSGSFRFDVVPNPARQFVVETGAVTVRVLGTRFVVAPRENGVEIAVERGRVEVGWAGGRTELGVGESGLFPPLVDASEVTASGSSASGASTTRSMHTGERAQFIEFTRKGDYQAAYSILDRSPQLFGNTAEDLMLAADAARLSNHPREAVGYLQRITKEHPSDSRAPLAAFTLGRIYMSQLKQPAPAARAFAMVRQLAPAGALVEDAMAREAEALEQAGQHEAAQKMAGAYLKRYPSGRRSEQLRQLLH